MLISVLDYSHHRLRRKKYFVCSAATIKFWPTTALEL